LALLTLKSKSSFYVLQIAFCWRSTKRASKKFRDWWILCEVIEPSGSFFPGRFIFIFIMRSLKRECAISRRKVINLQQSSAFHTPLGRNTHRSCITVCTLQKHISPSETQQTGCTNLVSHIKRFFLTFFSCTWSLARRAYTDFCNVLSFPVVLFCYLALGANTVL